MLKQILKDFLVLNSWRYETECRKFLITYMLQVLSDLKGFSVYCTKRVDHVLHLQFKFYYTFSQPIF